MKSFAFVFAVLLAGVHALPNIHVEDAIRSGQQRLVTDSIAGAIGDLSQAIIDAGLDPLIIKEETIDYALPVPSIFNVQAHLRGLLFQGASNIVINQLNFNVISLRLTFNIEIPQILLNVVDSEIDANLFGTNLNGRFRGRLAINNIVTTGNVRMSMGIISGIAIRDIAINFKLGGIDSKLNLFVQHVDHSKRLNIALGGTLPATLDAYAPEIDELLTIIVRDLIESML